MTKSKESVFGAAPPLPDWLADEMPFRRRIFAGAGHTVHFVDDGDGPVVWLQHGNPTWCYLWRKVIRLLLDRGMRVIAPDLVGLGLSDKPRDPAVHTLAFHGGQAAALAGALGLSELTIVGQDWGGPIMAALAARRPGLVRAAVFANTSLAAPRRPPRLTWFHRLSHMPVVSDMFFRYLMGPARMMARVQGDPASIGPAQRRAYLYPLARLADRAAPLALARMVPDSLEHPTVAALAPGEAWAAGFAGPVRLVWGTRDPIMGPALRGMRKLFPGAPVVETQAGHFLQEEVPEVLAEAIVAVAGGARP